MDLISAIKSGRRFKRPGTVWVDNNYDRVLCITLNEILSDDWQVEPEVYEFEDRWSMQNGIIAPEGHGNCLGVLEKLMGKKCKVRVEVIG